MNRIRNLLLLGLCVSLFVPVTGAAKEKPEFSGFLGDYSGFEESPKISGAWRHIKPGATIKDLQKYNKIMLDLGMEVLEELQEELRSGRT